MFCIYGLLKYLSTQAVPCSCKTAVTDERMVEELVPVPSSSIFSLKTLLMVDELAASLREESIHHPRASSILRIAPNPLPFFSNRFEDDEFKGLNMLEILIPDRNRITTLGRAVYGETDEPQITQAGEQSPPHTGKKSRS
ncbi:hypothetical protein CEXT_321021 [Caerostris extrusa]|uniref:Uncharacterized protein n=1 Tax=Caerostris extrusa TaxID=172846 RepID=A0AAV4NWA9_CAEEX|nr:hypothetical protein CEXT_321021 [Caerostris extrusa]